MLKKWIKQFKLNAKTENMLGESFDECANITDFDECELTAKFASCVQEDVQNRMKN